MLKDIGMSINIRSVEDITTPITKGDYTAAMYSLQSAPFGDPSFILNILYASTGAWNVQLGYQSNQADDLAKRMTAETDGAKRADLARQAEQLLQEDVPAVFLMQPIYLTGHSPKLKGFEPHTLEPYLLDHTYTLS